MKISIPAYVEERASHGVQDYAVRPLFARGPEFVERSLARSLKNLADSLCGEFVRLRWHWDHHQLLDATFSPRVESRVHTLEIEERRRKIALRFLIVVVKTAGMRVAFTPSLPDLWSSRTLPSRFSPRPRTARELAEGSCFVIR